MGGGSTLYGTQCDWQNKELRHAAVTTLRPLSSHAAASYIILLIF